MCEEKLKKVIDMETEKIRDKYDQCQNLVRLYQIWEVKKMTGIDIETIKLMRSKLKKENKICELQTDIRDLDYEISYNMGFEMGVMESKYSAAYQLLKNDWKIEDIARITELDQDQIKQLID